MSDNVFSIDDYLDSIGVIRHYGTPRHSGRYPWGSGEAGTVGTQRNKAFLDHVDDLKRQGLSDVEIARGMNMSTTQLRAAKSIAKNANKQAEIAMAQRLKDKQYSNVAIAERMGKPESSVRAMLADGAKEKVEVLNATSDMLKSRVDESGFIDVGTGVEHHIPGVSRNKLDNAVAVLQDQGYEVHKVQIDQVGSQNKTTVKVLCKPGTTYVDVVKNSDKIEQVKTFSDDGGRTFMKVQPPMSIDSKRVGIRYAEDGGKDADGVIYVRPGVKDVSFGPSRYAQVRVSVDGTHYLKGMAVYKDDLPEGVDLLFNTNKSNTGNKHDAMKPYKDDPENPFGSTVRQMVDPKTGKVTSVMNRLGTKEDAGIEGSWDQWSRNLSSQFLSKQSPQLAKQQLDISLKKRQADFDEIMALTNPTVKKKLLESYADGADSAAVHLKAAKMPRQSTHVILPVNSLKDTEVYAPNFKHGERVVLVRYPHGGTFEIPELVVNKNNVEGKKLLGQAKDAIGINAKVAERLSGADFDGDTVLVIPNNEGKIKTSKALEGLKNFDPQTAYPKYEGMKLMNARTKGIEMGKISNLITDMTIAGASQDELARAVRHSMVVIDAEKHKLNYRQSEDDNLIKQLRTKYQNGPNGGASTLISRATSTKEIRARKPRSPGKGGHIDPKTGRVIYEDAGREWVDSKGNVHYKKQKIEKLADTDNAFDLVSAGGGTKMEHLYANYSNATKALANDARKATLSIKPTPYSPSAKKAFDPQVKTLNAKLTLAVKNRPLERQAQVIANATIKAKQQANPDMPSDELKKLKSQALTAARLRTGASKNLIHIEDDEWSAIQAGAITNSKLKDILDNADLDRVKDLATPRQALGLSTSNIRRAEALIRSGRDQAEVAEILGISVSTLKRGLEGTD